jgi:nucleoside-diphosphate-sugar epimerase
MRVLVAGATGALGRQLVPALLAAGHDVVSLARSDARAAGLVGRGSSFMVADALSRDSLLPAVDRARPDAVVNLLTSIPRDPDPRRAAREFALTNLLRTEGTRNLIEAAAAVGADRFVMESIAFGYQPAPGRNPQPADEDAGMWLRPPRPIAAALRAALEGERLAGEVAGTVLRFGHLYGPGTVFDMVDGAFVRRVRAGKVPVVGGGNARFSFLHTADAASAVAAVLGQPASGGTYNIVDDDPTPVHVWLPELARMLGAIRPRSVPGLLARGAVGSWGVAYLSRLRGASNERARAQLGWRPRYPSWRDGLREEVNG